jgi:hypothetical protein
MAQPYHTLSHGQKGLGFYMGKGQFYIGEKDELE